MVDRRYRLREEHDVKRVRSRGRSVAHGALVLRFMPNNTEPPQNRYTVIAGKKCGNAVHRNRLKRLVREALRAWHPILHPGHDVAIVCRGGIEEMPDLATAQTTLQHILERTNLVQQGSTPPTIGAPVRTSWKQKPAEATDENEENG